MSYDPFSLFSKGREVKFYSSDNKDLLEAYTNTHLLLTNDIEIRTVNTYGSILGEVEPNNLLNILASSFTFANFSIPAQNSLQSIAIWQKTDPLTMSLEVSVPMVNSGRRDVVEPMYQLIGYTLPSKVDDNKGIKGSLIPPGPNLAAILDTVGLSSEKVGGAITAASFNIIKVMKSKGVIKIKVGEYLTLPDCVITGITPTFSKELDEDYFPISCTATIDIQTVEVATEQMFLSMINSLPLVDSTPIKYTKSKGPEQKTESSQVGPYPRTGLR